MEVNVPTAAAASAESASEKPASFLPKIRAGAAKEPSCAEVVQATSRAAGAFRRGSDQFSFPRCPPC